MQLSSLIGKPILTRTGDQIGYVTGAYLTKDLKKLSALAAADGEEEDIFLPAKSILSLSDAVIASDVRIPAPTGLPSPIGLPAYSPEGGSLGAVCDVLLGEEPILLLTKEGVRTAVPVHCALLSETVIVYADGKKPARRRQKPQGQDDRRREASDRTESGRAEPQSPPPQAAPERRDLFGRDLLGRKVIKSVYDAGGTLIAAAGERITPEIISLARRRGRLLALTVNTITTVQSLTTYTLP